MSKAVLALVLAGVLASCATAVGPPPETAETHGAAEVRDNLDLAIEITSWGRLVERWELRPDRTLRTWQQDFNTGERKNERTATLDVSSHRQLLAAASRLRSLRSLDYCEGAPTDGPTTHYEWPSAIRPDKVSIYVGCYSVERTAEIQRAYDAEEAVFAVIAAHLPRVS